MNNVMLYLGRAVHTLADKTSPAHVDEYGLPKEWVLTTSGHSPTDWFGAERIRDITPAILAQARASLTAACAHVTGP